MNSSLCIKVSYSKRLFILSLYFLIGYVSLFLILNAVEGNPDFDKTGAFALTLIPSLIMGTGSAFGESTILGYLRNYPKDYVSGWSSGTGLAGVVGAMITLLSTIYDVELKTLYLVISPICVVYYLFFFFVDKAHKAYIQNIETGLLETDIQEKDELLQNDVSQNKSLTFKTGLQAFKSGKRFILNLALVYMLEYTILSGFSERTAYRGYIKDEAYKNNVRFNS